MHNNNEDDDDMIVFVALRVCTINICVYFFLTNHFIWASFMYKQEIKEINHKVKQTIWNNV